MVVKSAFATYFDNTDTHMDGYCAASFFTAMQIYEIRQLVQCIRVIVLIHREICLVGMLPHLAIMVQLKQFHQVSVMPAWLRLS